MKRLEQIMGIGVSYQGTFGYLSLVVLLACAFNTTLINNIVHDGPDLHLITPFGFLPETLISSLFLANCLRVLFTISSIFWIAGFFLKFIGFTTTFLYIFHQSLYLERIIYADHSFYIVAQILILFSFWSLLYAKKENTNSYHLIGKVVLPRYLSIYPKWLIQLTLLSFTTFYGYSFLAKIVNSGWSWANGHSLQLWLFLWGNSSHSLTQSISGNFKLAQYLQVGALIFELLAFGLLIGGKKFRFLWFTLHLIFTAGNEALYGYGFTENLILSFVFLLPWERKFRRA